MANIPDRFPGYGDMMSYEEFSADKVYLYVQEVLSDYPGLAANTKFSAIKDVHIQNLVMRLQTWCVAGRVPSREETETIEYPDGPWQALKEAYAPEWFKAKHPVRMKSIVTKRQTHHYFMCPHLQVDDRNTHIRFMMTSAKSANRPL